MAASIALTQRLVESLDFNREVIGIDDNGRLRTRKVKSGRHDWMVRDTIQRGLLVRLSPAGAATYYVQRKHNGVRYLRAFANARHDGYGVYLSLPAARRRAQELIGMIAKGEDPTVERKNKQKQALIERDREHNKMRDAFDALLAAKVKKDRPATRKDRVAVQTWMADSPLFAKPVVDVTRQDVAESLEPILLRAKGHAEACAWGPKRVSAGSFTKTYAYCAQAWRMAMEELGVVKPNPFRGWRSRVVFPKQRSRQTFIDTRADAGKHWIRALVELRDQTRESHQDTRAVVADCVLCMLIWGTRFQETTLLEWESVRFDEGIIFLTEETTKSRTLDAVPLTRWAAEILRERQAENARWRPGSRFVFPGRRRGKPLTDLRGVLRIANAATGQHITAHDFRRTMTADIGERKSQAEAAQLLLAGAVLHHTQSRGGPISSATVGYLVRKTEQTRAIYQEREDQLRRIAGLDVEAPADAAPSTLADIMAQIDALTKQARELAAKG